MSKTSEKKHKPNRAMSQGRTKNANGARNGATNAPATNDCVIDHPKNGQNMDDPCFMSFGRIAKHIRPRGELIDKENKPVAVGRLVLLTPSRRYPKHMIWAMQFSIHMLAGGDYTLRIYDESTKKELLSNKVKLAAPRAAHAGSKLDGVHIYYPPTGEGPLPLEFVACGSAAVGGGDVSGTMSNCDTPPTSITELVGPPEWMLYCSIVNPGASCTLTVTQGTDSDSSGGLTFGSS